MSYNLLNFPDPNPAGKQDTLAQILTYHPVDLLIVQELKDQFGADLILDQALNINGITRYASATFVPQQSDPFSQVKLSQLLYFDQEKFTLVSEEVLTTIVRDINVYTVFLNDVDLAQTQDTTFLVIYGVHLKASTGAVNESEREQMAQVLMAHLAGLPSNTSALVAGDMNMYASTEPAYAVLTDPNHPVRFMDPLTFLGTWNSNSAMAPQHTQSTRSNQLFGDGAGGGLDDRFDVAFFSPALMDQNATLHFSIGSYRPLGNSGTCFNSDILDCSTTQTPYSILRSLYYMSDHLPLVFELYHSRTVTSVPGQSILGSIVLDARSDGSLFVISEGAGTGVLEVYDPMGRMHWSGNVSWNAGRSAMDPPATGSGVRVIRLMTNDRQLVERIFIRDHNEH